MRESLHTKGWTKKEIDHLDRHYSYKQEEIVILAVALLLLAFAIVAIPYGYALMGAILTEPVFQITLGIIAVPLGAVFGLLLVDLDRLEKHHHIGLLIAVPLIAFMSTAILINRANILAPEGAFIHNALIGGIVYALAFTIPYGFLVIHGWNSKIGQSSM